jgi:hypothetical protein
VRNPKYVKELKLPRERFRRFDKVLAADVRNSNFSLRRPKIYKHTKLHTSQREPRRAFL